MTRRAREGRPDPQSPAARIAGIQAGRSGPELDETVRDEIANGLQLAGVYGRNEAVGGYGVRGFATNADGAGVYGSHLEGGIGVYGNHDSTTESGTGVLGRAVIGPGVVGRGSTYDLLANGNGRIGVGQTGHDGTPSDGGSAGTLARDGDRNLWYCHTDGQWQRVGGPVAGGAFHPITPFRAYDSRLGAIPNSGAFSADSERVIAIQNSYDKDDGSLLASDVVPPGATGITFNVTVTATTGNSFLSMNPGDAADFNTATLNWSGGATVGNASVVKLDDSRQVKIFTGPNGTFHTIIDITGYYI